MHVRVVREQPAGRRLCLTGAQRRRLAIKGKVTGRKALGEAASIVTPDTIGPSQSRNWKADPLLEACGTLEPDDYTGAHGALGSSARAVSFYGRSAVRVAAVAISRPAMVHLAAGGSAALKLS